MAYMALYRTFRPKNFHELIGQNHISQTLIRGIDNKKLSHAYLFSGSRGTGKTSTAKILAKSLNCINGPTSKPCNTCENCQKINAGTFMDVYEIDAASNRGIDEIRELRETVKYTPVEGKYKVYIIDEVHMLTTEAFNALLKTLEEPPEYVIFILATTEIHKVPITIQSRCQRYDFKKIQREDIKNHLKNVVDKLNYEAEDEALNIISLAAEGGMRDALSILDQCINFSDGTLTEEDVNKVLGLVGKKWIFNLTESIIKKEDYKCLAILNDIIHNGKDYKQIILEFTLYMRSLMIYKATKRIDNLDMYLETEENIKSLCENLSYEYITEILKKSAEALNNLKFSPNQRITLETFFLNICWQNKEDNIVKTKSPATIEKEENQPLSSNEINRLEDKIYHLENLIKKMEISFKNRDTIEEKIEEKKEISSTQTIEYKEEIAPTHYEYQFLSNTNSTKLTSKIKNIENTPKKDNLELRKKVKKSSAKGKINIIVPPNLILENINNINTLWNNALKVINSFKDLSGLKRSMNYVQPIKLENNTLHLGAEVEFAQNVISGNISILEEIIEKITSRHIKIKISKDDNFHNRDNYIEKDYQEYHHAHSQEEIKDDYYQEDNLKHTKKLEPQDIEKEVEDKPALKKAIHVFDPEEVEVIY